MMCPRDHGCVLDHRFVVASRGLLFCRAVAAAGDGLRRLYGNNARNLLGETALNKGNGVKEGRVCDAQEVR
jgi:hypothetical protein